MTILGPSRAGCTHSETTAVLSARIERILCKSCHNVSFMFLDDMTDEIDRDMFSRTVDQPKIEDRGRGQHLVVGR